MNLELNKEIPDGQVTLTVKGHSTASSIHKLFAKKRVVLFAVPGAFSKNCSSVHFPSYVRNEQDFYNQKIDVIACLAVNDVDVMRSWKETFDQNQILMISDGDASYVRNVKLSLNEGIDAGIRSQRFAAVIDNLIIKRFWVDEKKVLETHANNVLNCIKSEGF